MDAHRRVEQAFEAIPRTAFLPPSVRGDASYDGPLPIGHGATNSQPRTVFAMLVELAVEPGQRVLDVGAGSGWTTALLGWLTGPKGAVEAVELIPELVSMATKNLATFAMPQVRMHQASRAVLGLPEAGPYDRILVSADGGQVPAPLVAQLAEGGRMVIPAAGLMNVVERCGGEIATHHVGRYNFVPLLWDE